MWTEDCRWSGRWGCLVWNYLWIGYTHTYTHTLSSRSIPDSVNEQASHTFTNTQTRVRIHAHAHYTLFCSISVFRVRSHSNSYFLCSFLSRHTSPLPKPDLKSLSTLHLSSHEAVPVILPNCARRQDQNCNTWASLLLYPSPRFPEDRLNPSIRVPLLLSGDRNSEKGNVLATSTSPQTFVCGKDVYKVQEATFTTPK